MVKFRTLYHIKSDETESYLQKIVNKSYFEQYKSVSINNETILDAATGATITSKAIAKTVTIVIGEAKNGIITNYVDTNDDLPFSIKAKLDKWWIFHISIIVFFFIYNFHNKFMKTKKLVLVINILSLIYIGFFLNNSFTYVTFIHLFVGISLIAGKIIVIKTNDGKYAKLEIVSYYKNITGSETPYYTFNYKYQPNGSRTLE